MTYELHLGDCLEIMPGLHGIDAIITDPPYLTADSGVPVGSENGGVANAFRKTQAIGMPWGYSLEWIDIAAQLKPKQWVVYCNSFMLSGLIAKLEVYAKFGTVFVWRKSNAPMMTRNVPRFDCEFIVWAKAHDTNNVRARDFRSQVLDVPMPQAGCFASEREIVNGGPAAHPTQKPLKVVLPFVRNLTEAGWTVLDPFVGTGTTGVACLKLGRRFVGVEISPAYHAIAVKRCQDAAAQPVLIPHEAQPQAQQEALL